MVPLLLGVARPFAPARADVVHGLSQRHVVNRSRPISRTSHRVQQHREHQLQGTRAYRSSLERHEGQLPRPASAARMLGRPPANVLQTFWAVAANVLQTSDRRNPAKPGETTHAIPRVYGVSCPRSLGFAEHEPIGETGFEPATARPPAGCATRLRHSPWCSSILRTKPTGHSPARSSPRRYLGTKPGEMHAKHPSQ
jgi:hypothetical protein